MAVAIFRLMETRLLQTFVAVAEAGTISAAASELGYVQSSVSEQLQRLEAEVGASLLVRTSTGVTPTAEGRRLLPEARRVIDAVADLRHSVRGRRPLRIGAVDTLALRWLPAVIAALPEETDRPTITMDRRDHLLRALVGGRSDVAFLYRSPGGSLPHLGRRLQAAANRLRVEVLAEDDLAVVSAPGEDAEGWLVTQIGCVHREAFERHIAGSAGNPPIAAEAATPEALRQLALGGAGRALLPRLAIAADLAEGNLVVGPDSEPVGAIEIVAVHPPDSGAEVHRFLRRAVDHALAR